MLPLGGYGMLVIQTLVVPVQSNVSPSSLTGTNRRTLGGSGKLYVPRGRAAILAVVVRKTLFRPYDTSHPCTLTSGCGG